MKRLIDWVDSRTGVRQLLHEALYEKIPGGARWRYVWGSTLTFALFVQVVTGIVLWMAYAPSAQTAWASVYYIQHEMTGGWILRGIHHFTAQTMTVLLVLHLMQVVIDGAYKAPREVNFWFGVALLFLVLALSLTGYLLPWDQKGYWATNVATNIAAITPFIGPEIQKLIIGGADYGHHTLTRFFALHAGVLPGAIFALLVGHIYLFRKHGITAKQPLRRPTAAFWPDQVLMDAVACLAVMATVMFLVIRNHGAELAAPADPSEPYSAARPEWYFLFLFQFLKYFSGGTEIIGAMVIPGFVALLICAMPFFGQWKLGHRFNCAMLAFLLGGAGFLTYQALQADRKNPDYLEAVVQGHKEAERVIELAGSPMGIPESGAVSLLRNDPLTKGPRLFAKHCASCHRYGGHDGLGQPVADKPSAPDLMGFGSREWLSGLLNPERVGTEHYFGGTRFKEGKMVRFVRRDVAKYDAAKQENLKKVIMALSAEAKLERQADIDKRDAALIKEGRQLLASEGMRCTECHSFAKPSEDAIAPELTGYASRSWLIDFIADPTHSKFYGSRNDRMPAFGQDKLMDQKSMELLTDWLRGSWYEAPRSAKQEVPATAAPGTKGSAGQP